ncbi:unnamed protein product [Acanthoscelides obtectus]|uniref:Uncharacterized protein n=1 Tax=Acanthoscelides obtectus TaxID=200917 RepID=A0A9P0QC46_ACAOB|nr:unnamed protein product [Acanthoscelides obtectus]CAK1677282.1 Cyclic nucleotide-gated cation channel beta-1 [Acanthoscelides obtectus]
MNRRTADVRSKGYSNLFVLSKTDLNAALSHYPEAQELLNKKAKTLMKKNASLERKYKDAMIVINNPTTPAKDAKLLETVLQMLPPESNTNKLLRFGSRGKPRISPQYDKFKQSRNSLPLPSLLPLKRELEAMQKENRRLDKWKPRLTGHTFQCPVMVHRSMS